MSLRVVFFLAALATFASADDRSVLMDIYNAAGGAEWTTSTGWGSSTDMCKWFGVQCDHDGYGAHVISVSLSNNNLVGEIPASVGDLSGLKILDLSQNKLKGELPAVFDKASNLQYLRLNNNGFTGPLPPTFQNFSVTYPNLVEIQLQYNNLTGGIPESMFGPATEPVFAPEHVLKVLNVGYNGLTGLLPNRLAREKSLVSFLIAGDDFSGAVDPTLGKLLNGIKYCDLSGGTFKCPLPDGLDTKCQAVCK